MGGLSGPGTRILPARGLGNPSNATRSTSGAVQHAGDEGSAATAAPTWINLASEGYYDILWNDIYHYGRVQDSQAPVPLNRISSLGFSVGARGGHDGQFRLEFDYIGVEYDPSHTEEFAYEMYQQQKYIVAT
ncbi:hypothetical protein quinque_014630 [Culex quinquefasciatus]